MSRYYGSINNRIDENRVGRPEPAVGLGLTEYCWSDRHAYRIVEIVAYRKKDGLPKEIIATPCWIRPHEWYDGHADVSLSVEKPEDEEGKAKWIRDEYTFHLFRTRKGNWTSDGTEGGTKYCVTENPSEYRDPSF